MTGPAAPIAGSQHDHAMFDVLERLRNRFFGKYFAFLPDIGTGVWIEFEGGDVSLPIWAGCYWFDGEPPSDATASIRAIVTKAGQKILLNVDSGTITIEDGNGNSILLGSDGLTLKGSGQSIALGSSGVSVNNGALAVT
jgi:hypothetical protein